MGGSLTMEDTPAGGLTVVISLPAIVDAVPPAQNADEARAADDVTGPKARA